MIKWLRKLKENVFFNSNAPVDYYRHVKILSTIKNRSIH